MGTTIVKGYTVGKIEQDIPVPVGHKRLLSVEQKQLLQMKDGESFVLVLHFDSFLTDNAQRLVQWARSKGIHALRRKIDSDSVRIWRVGLLQPVDKQQRESGKPHGK
jgi:hypothetical protein